ncbi:23S rRNA (pseudouridine(1915)-N(3))-methyltransferase RlmH [Thiocapsa bogorovii]|uniref:23S rRNA (pseudouridine(1915)-N(3))-methyltransferase RlmH n=1 Tax=Thiocapsa bogorovii TaxID=521689 RepID=UPI001E3F407C|nr:23S rRNA (pseudouridine(1915)-N(3))-methyltransferase RlmH [Thiocapsa bogorovii]UHD14880.1 23S rRNA (pseudouridine(1915)-N(3))-methyltransferase RlmH [Thiocapsa bogorovii]
MRVRLIAVGRRMPGWVESGYAEYAKRLPSEFALSLAEIEPGQRGKGCSPERAGAAEGKRILKAIPNGARVVALDGAGEPWSTEALAEQLRTWLAGGRDLALLVGGPEGLAEPCLARADQRWSLSRLTFPHPLVRVIVAEQLYRAWTLVQGHPYHRGG